MLDSDADHFHVWTDSAGHWWSVVDFSCRTLLVCPEPFPTERERDEDATSTDLARFGRLGTFLGDFRPVDGRAAPCEGF